MSPTRLPRLGSVIWAELADANGLRKVRPAVVVTATADIAAGKPIRVAAITTRLPNPLPDDHVLLPWDRQGKAHSGLRRPCAAIATWLAQIPLEDVRDVVGFLRPTVIDELLAKIAAASAPPPAPTSAGASAPADPSTPPSDAADEPPTGD